MPEFNIAKELAPLLTYGPVVLLVALAVWAIVVMYNAGRQIDRE
jgi:hypothetical protein